MVKFFETTWKNQKIKIPYRVSYYAIKMLKERDGIVFSKIQDDDFESYEPLLFYAIEQGYRIINKENPFRREDMCDLLDQVMMEFIQNIPGFFQVATPEPPPEVQKKVVAGKK